jgi:type IV fimbrial biogenesis protein FimT
MDIQSHGTGKPLQTGVTVLELMITLSIAAILFSASLPAYQQFTWKQRMKAAVNALHNDLMTARSDAVLNGTPVVICPGNPATGCLGSNNWSTEWIIFRDHNGDRQHQQDEILLRHGYGSEQVKILSSIHRTNIRFFPGGTAPGANGTISLCGPGGPENARKVVISNIGRIRRDTHPTINPTLCPG